MPNDRDNYEPIIADKRSREPLREDTRPLWQFVLALGGGLVVAVLLAWWWMDRSSNHVAATPAESESSASEIRPEDPPVEHIEETPAPPARDIEQDADFTQAPVLPVPSAEPALVEDSAAAAEQTLAAEDVPEVVADAGLQVPVPPAPASVRFTSPDAQVQIEMRGTDESSPVTSKAGDVVAIAPGTYRVIVSGTQLETFEQEVTFDGARSYEYNVELCAERKQERQNLAGRVVEERPCATTAQCESMFMVLNEHAEQLVKARDFRTQECAKWRANAAPEGSWTLNTACGGATLATTCRIEIAEGVCTFEEPRRSARGAECPRAELK